MSALFLDAFNPDPHVLLSQVSRYIDDAILEEFAEADYGQDKAGHLTELRKIRDDGVSSGRLNWNPCEVLELIRWSEPDDPEWKPGGNGKRGHQMRAFACAALLTASANLENEDLREGWNSTLIQLIDSLGALGPEFYEAACSLVAFLIRKFKPDQDADELAFLGVGLLWFTLNLQRSIPDSDIIALSEWIVARERDRERNCRPGDTQWLLGTTFFDQKHEAWKRLGRRLQDQDNASRSVQARDWVQLIGASLSG